MSSVWLRWFQLSWPQEAVSSAPVRENKTLWPRFCRRITNLQAEEEREKGLCLFYQSKVSLERLTWSVKVFRGHSFCADTVEMDSRDNTSRSVEVGSRWAEKFHHISWSSRVARSGLWKLLLLTGGDKTTALGFNPRVSGLKSVNQRNRLLQENTETDRRK